MPAILTANLNQLDAAVAERALDAVERRIEVIHACCRQQYQSPASCSISSWRAAAPQGPPARAGQALSFLSGLPEWSASSPGTGAHPCR